MRRRLFRAKIASGKILAVLPSMLSRRKGGFRVQSAQILS
jgi:hypothetical protein